MKIAVLGCGVMASAVTKALYKHNKDVKFYTYTPSMHRAKALADEVNGVAIDTLSMLEDVDYIIVGCKPYQFNELSLSLKKINLTSKTIISLMAAVPVQRIQESLNCSSVIRLMPSLPVIYDEGISLLLASAEVETKVLKNIKQKLEYSSQVLILKDEEQFDKFTVITASGPAYVYYFINVFQEILMEWGLKEDIAKLVAKNLFKGSTTSALNSINTLQEDIAAVTSNKGVTIEGINSFQNDNVSALIKKGAFKAYSRSVQISKNIDHP